MAIPLKTYLGVLKKGMVGQLTPKLHWYAMTVRNWFGTCIARAYG
jgi:hypothetical protein